MNEIVVGLDLSPSARAALKWAAAQARATGQTVRAVHAFDTSPTFTMGLGMRARRARVCLSDGRIPRSDLRCLRLHPARTRLAPEVLPRRSGAGPGGRIPRRGAARSRHEGACRHRTARPGSVSHHCLGHAQCPVVAVPAVRAHVAEALDRDQAATGFVRISEWRGTE